MEYAKAQEIRNRHAASVCSRIRSDRERASADMRRLLDELEAHLFDVEFDVGTAYEALDRSEEDARREFHLLTGTAPKYYLRDLRLQVAQRLLETTSLTVTMVSELAGYGSLKSIGRAFRDRFGMSPSDYRRHYAAAEAHFPPDLPQKLEEGRLEEEEARVLIAYLRAHHPEVLEDSSDVRLAADNDPTRPGVRAVSVEELEELNAERLWLEIEHLPRDAQVDRVRQATFFTFTTPALFHYLQKTSVKLGRENRSRGVQIAELALIAAVDFEYPDLTTGKCTLWARAWANLGNSRRLALELDPAERAFEQAEYFLPGEPTPAVLGEILDLKAMLRWYQRDYADGLALEERAIPLLEEAGETEALAKALIVQAILCDYTGNFQGSLESLSRALELVPCIDNPDVTMAAHYNLARCYRKLGDYERACTILEQLRDLSKQSNIPIYNIYIEWFEGRIALDMQNSVAAEKHLLAARSGFLLANSKARAGFVGLDLAIAYHENGKETEALQAAQEAIAVLDIWRDHAQLKNAWRKLKRIIITRSINRKNLIAIRDATDHFQEDPWNQEYLDLAIAAV